VTRDTTHKNTSLRLLVSAVLAAALLSACAGDKKDEYVERPVNDIYNAAVDLMKAGSYPEAAVQFDEVERQHPYSIWATKAQIQSAYAHYMANKYDEAIITLNRFISLHPGNRDIAYAYYLKALSYYEQISDVSRDQNNTQQALSSLREVVRRFPNTRYARDATLKIDLTRDHLAGKEMAVGRYYLRRGEYLAAINRFRKVIDEFQTTTHVPEALHRITEAYASVGLVAEAKKAAAVLGHNYPGSPWYADSYGLVTEGKARSQQAENKGFFSRAWDWMF
jgi:outer membrane protein assembly factor BamD